MEWPFPKARVLMLCDPRAESPMETRLRMILIAGRLPWPVTQYPVYDENGFVARLDLAYPQYKIGVEYDGDHHRTRDAFQRDLRRINALHACGWTILEALDKAVPVPTLTAALFTRFRSRQEDSFAERMLAAMRKAFGGHAVKTRQ